jgi:hypothetical protein
MLAIDTLVLLVGAAVYAVWFRTLPFVAYAVMARRVRWVGKLIALWAGVGLFAVCEHIHGHGALLLRDALMSWSYMVLAALLVHHAVPFLRSRGCTSSGIFVGSAMLFLGLPGVLIRTPTSMTTSAIGFELMFAAHSYAFEQTRARQRASLGEALVFLLVNPTLVYPARGIDHGVSQWSLRGGGRALIGVLGILVASLAPASVAVGAQWLNVSTVSRLPGGALVTYSIVLIAQLFAEYLGHSSLASYQIGTMRLFGYDLPERYNYPFLARTPDELWRRWNLYIGAWLQRYAYLPLAMRYQRRLPRAWWTVGKGLALLSAFGVCGLAHEAVGYATRFNLPIGAALGFVLYGVVLTLWLGLGQLLRKLGQRLSWTQSAWWRAGNGALGWSISFATLVAFAWVALPALSGLGLSGPIARWVAP